MKIDYIIGNPPYIGGLYKDIWLRCIKKLAPNGRIQFITPVGFVRQQGEPDRNLRDYIQRYKTTIDMYHNLDIFPVGAVACGGGIAVTDIDFSKGTKDTEDSNIVVRNHNDPNNNYQFQSRLINNTIPIFKQQLMMLEKFKDTKKLKMDYLNPYKEALHNIPHRGGSRVQNTKTPRKAIGYKNFYRKTTEISSRVFYVEDHPFFDSNQNPLKNKFTIIQHEMDIGDPVIVEPGTVFDELYYIIGVEDTLEEAQLFVNYLKSAPVQCHLAMYVSTIKASKRPYKMLPNLEDGMKIKYSEEELSSIKTAMIRLNKTLVNFGPFIEDTGLRED